MGENGLAAVQGVRLRSRSAGVRITSGVAVIALGLFLVASVAAQVTPEQWGLGIADRLEPLLPAAIPGLVGRLPWDSSSSHDVVKSSGCTNEGCPAYQYVYVSQSWRIDDPVAVKEYEQLVAEGERLVRRAGELGRKAPPAELMKLGTDVQRVEERQKAIKLASRSVEVRFRGNLPAEGRQDRGTKPSGKIKGFPFYRVPDGSAVHLRVYLGPQGFANPMIAPGKTSQTEVKCILVEVQLNSKPGLVAKDEPLARQLLEGIDYPALAKFLGR